MSCVAVTRESAPFMLRISALTAVSIVFSASETPTEIATPVIPKPAATAAAPPTALMLELSVAFTVIASAEITLLVALLPSMYAEIVPAILLMASTPDPAAPMPSFPAPSATAPANTTLLIDCRPLASTCKLPTVSTVEERMNAETTPLPACFVPLIS